MVENDFVLLDVLGTRIRATKNLLSTYSSSLFGDLLNNSARSYDNLPTEIVKINAREFFVQRSPDLVKILFQYLLNGKLHVPHHICREELLEEFAFWRLQPTAVCFNCAKDYEDITRYQQGRKTGKLLVETSNRCGGIRRKIWAFLEHPTSSIPAMAFNVLSLLFILLSIVNVMLVSMPELQFCTSNDGNTTDSTVNGSLDDESIFDAKCTGTKVYFLIDLICIAWFTMEVILRILACPSLKTYFTAPLNIIDIFAVLPFYIELFIVDYGDEGFRKARAVLMVLRMLRVIRIFRILKLARYLTSLRVLGYTITAARNELNMLFLFIMLATFIFSNFLYQLEKDLEGTAFTSIPASFWWCIVTLTTVGYGDVVPQTVAGKVFGSMTCICGIIVVAFPIAVLVDKFLLIYKKYEKQPVVKFNEENECREISVNNNENSKS